MERKLTGADWFCGVLVFVVIVAMIIGICTSVSEQKEFQYEVSNMQCKEYIMKLSRGDDSGWQKVVSCERKE